MRSRGAQHARHNRDGLDRQRGLLTNAVMLHPRHQTERDALVAFAAAVRQDRRANTDAAGEELLLTPRMQALVENLVALRAPLGPAVLPERPNSGFGRPDLTLRRSGEPPRAFIELKQPETNIDPRRLRGHDLRQFERFRELPLWAMSNFHTIRLYRRAELLEETAVVPAQALDPGTSDAAAERAIRQSDTAGLGRIIEALAQAKPVQPRTPRDLAEALAHSARLVRGVVLEQSRADPTGALEALRTTFRETLFAHPTAGGFDQTDENELFANAFAQTLAFGLLLAREQAGGDIDRDAYRRLPGGIYPLLQATLRALTQDEILEILGIAFEVLTEMVNVSDMAMLTPRGDGYDPILYFYEDFLTVFDPAARKKHGVFFTPVPVVRFMVAATERALVGALGTKGLLDPDVLLLDPACGTGTFLIAAATAGREAARAAYGEGAVAGEMVALAQRLHGSELLVGPYTVAHYRMLREVRAADVIPTARLPIWFADTLTGPHGAPRVTQPLGFMGEPIAREREGADALKARTPILAIIGNPPYRRLSEGEDRTVFAGWDRPLWDDLKRAVSEAGWGGELNTFPELSVAFWRWCLWKLFESEGAPGRGVICLITNRTFLAGHPYAGLRREMRRRFDAIDIVDLRGDSRGARPAGITTDENVFEIQTGVCILIGVATGQPRTTEAVVRYADVWRNGAFTSREKLELLTSATSNPSLLAWVTLPEPRTNLDDLLPAAFGSDDWPSISEVFNFAKSGSKSQRDDLVYALSAPALQSQIERFQSAPEDEAKVAYFAGATSATIARAATGRRLASFLAARREPFL